MSNARPGRSPPSTKSVAPPVRAGVAVGHLRGSTYGAPQRVVETPAPGPPPRLPSWKRLALRLFRPLKAAIHPVLFRLQTRMASAVDGSFTASVVLSLDQEMRTQLTRIETEMTDRLSMLADEVHDCRMESEQLRLKLEDNLAITMLQVGLGRSLGERMDSLLGRSVIPLKNAVAVRTEAGYVLAPADDDRAVVDLMECSGQLAPEVQAMIGRLLATGSRLVEVGARDGRLAVTAARLVGPEGQVLTFGGDEASTALIARAAQLNGTTWLQARHAGSAAHALDATTAGARVDLVYIAGETDPTALLQGVRRMLADNPHLAIAVRLGSPAGYGAWRDAFAADGLKASTPSSDQPGDLGEIDVVFTREAPPESGRVRS